MKGFLIVLVVLVVMTAVGLAVWAWLLHHNAAHDRAARWEMFSTAAGDTPDDGWEVGVKRHLHDGPQARVLHAWTHDPEANVRRQAEGEAIALAAEWNDLLDQAQFLRRED